MADAAAQMQRLEMIYVDCAMRMASYAPSQSSTQQQHARGMPSEIGSMQGRLPSVFVFVAASGSFLKPTLSTFDCGICAVVLFAYSFFLLLNLQADAAIAVPVLNQMFQSAYPAYNITIETTAGQ